MVFLDNPCDDSQKGINIISETFFGFEQHLLIVQQELPAIAHLLYVCPSATAFQLHSIFSQLHTPSIHERTERMSSGLTVPASVCIDRRFTNAAVLTAALCLIATVGTKL